jgi:hypothetical protein
MVSNRVGRSIRVAALAITVSVACGSIAWGQNYYRYDDDDYYHRHDQSREQGFHRGFDDGRRQGQVDAERGRRFKFKNDDWEDSRGYEHWMGDKGHYKHAYREGYERGYRRAYGDYDRRGYRDNGYRDRDDWR